MSTVTRRIPNISPQVELFGDWDRTKALLNGIESTIAAGALIGQRAAAEKLLKIVKKNIRENGGSIGWPQVSDKYAQLKRSMGYDPGNLLVLTGLYYKNISIRQNGLTFYVGLNKNIKNPKTGGKITLAKIAIILEHGSVVAKIKARPLWTPSFKQFGGSSRIKSLMVWHIRSLIMARHGIRAKISI